MARAVASDPERAAALADLRRIPGVGPSIADDLWRLGMRRVSDLRGRDPEALYGRFCALVGGPVDRCVLYVFRCAVYYAETPDPDPERLQWWFWKDRPARPRQPARARARKPSRGARPLPGALARQRAGTHA